MYEPNELKAIMNEQQKKIGCFNDTKDEKFKNKRLVRLSKFTEVAHEVIKTLQEWGLPFTLCEVLHSKKQKKGWVTTDIFIPNANIVMRVLDTKDEVEVSKAGLFYNHMKSNYYVFFIRDYETKEFVLKKLRNCLLKANKRPAKGFKGMKQTKPKRQRISGKRYEKITKRNNKED